jgi:hypothetical protein
MKCALQSSSIIFSKFQGLKIRLSPPRGEPWEPCVCRSQRQRCVHSTRFHDLCPVPGPARPNVVAFAYIDAPYVTTKRNFAVEPHAWRYCRVPHNFRQIQIASADRSANDLGCHGQNLECGDSLTLRAMRAVRQRVCRPRPRWASRGSLGVPVRTHRSTLHLDLSQVLKSVTGMRRQVEIP